MASAVHWGLVLVLWISFGWHLRAAGWWPRTPTRRSVCGAIGLLALGTTVLAPEIYTWLDRVTGVPNGSRLLGNSLAIGCGWAISPLRTRLLGRALVRDLLGSTWLAAAVLLAEAVLFALAPVDVSVPGDFAGYYAHSGYILAYRIILNAYLGCILAQLCWASWHNRALMRTLRRCYLQVRNHLHIIGWGCGALYSAHEIVYPLLARANLAVPGPVHRIVQYGLLSGFVLLLMGGNFLSVARWGSLYAAWQRLFPLWRELHTLVPSIAHNNAYAPVRSRGENLRAVGDLEYRVLSRVLEIADGLLTLRPYATSAAAIHAAVLCRRAGLPAEEAEAVVSATIVAEARRAPGRITAAARGHAVAPGRADLDSELDHYLRMARAYRRSRIVAASLQTTASGTATGGPRRRRREASR